MSSLERHWLRDVAGDHHPGQLGEWEVESREGHPGCSPRGVAIIGLDVLRRDILHVRDHPEALSVPYVDLSARFALDHGLHVVIEGILHSEIYGATLARLRSDHVGVTRTYRYDLELDETLRRHRTKPLAEEVSVDTVASWYRTSDPVRELDEVVFDVTVSAGDALERVLADVRWSDTGDSDGRSSGSA